jgi:WXG100 family type VII secretion target
MSDVKMSYEAMADMAAAFHQAQNTVIDTLSNLNNMVNMLEGGALIGVTGDRLAAALRTNGKKALSNALSKLTELEGDINGAMEDMRAGDATGRSLF